VWDSQGGLGVLTNVGVKQMTEFGEFFKKYCKIYTNDLFGSKSFLLLSMMREVLVFELTF
jgi:hypothetical protein